VIVARLIADPRTATKLGGWLLVLAACVAGSAVAVERLGGASATQAAVAAPAGDTSPIVVDYPLGESIFPPDIEAPTFLWRDGSKATSWEVAVTFADGGAPLQAKTLGPRMRVGEIDPRAVGPTNELPKLTAEQAAARTWKPTAAAWEAVKARSVEAAATVTITGFAAASAGTPVSRGQVVVRTSRDPVGAPIFYRDVPLMPSAGEKGVITPLATAKVPLIAWRLRNVADARSRLLLTGMHTCANCHSFSRDGKTLGMDLDGPKNDKGLYALVPVQPQATIRNQDVVAWSSFRGKLGNQLRVGFMSQVSPDGRYVVTTIKPRDAGSDSLTADLPLSKRQLLPLYYVANFPDYRFLQVFYPTGGILAWYDRTTGQLQPLPGADDPRFVQANSTWSPDGRYLVFARAEARDPRPPGSTLATRANDPNEVQLRYDLYRVPFNDGKGGQAEPIRGASGNGMSNSFPKISPDGRWIVYVQARNGLLMRPDSQLHIVPAEGGEARRMRCNTPLMNSWHSFSPNGRWMVFSSKSRTPYTQMFLTHLDEEGNDSPAILIENSTAANRAVNIPEFVNIAPDGLLKIDAPAAEFYRLFNRAAALSEKGRYAAAVPAWQQALALNPDDDRAQNSLGAALASTGKPAEAVPHFEKAVALNPDFDEAQSGLGAALMATGRIAEAIPRYEKALEINPENAEALANLGAALAQSGRLNEGILRLERAVALDPEFLGARANLGTALLQKGEPGQAVPHLEKAVALDPRSAPLQSSLGLALLGEGKPEEAIVHFRKAVATAPGSVEAHVSLATALHQAGRTAAALDEWRLVLRAVPDDVGVLAQAAWALATSPTASVRSGAEAVTLAERAVHLTGGREPSVLDALAAAYAEARRFPDAVRTAERALDLARQQGNPALAVAVDARLASYRAGAPWREKRP
jgi:tetratricopeptide (TPR) repeat protein